MSGSPKISKNKISANKEYSKILEDDSYLIKSSKNISQ